MHRGRKQCGRAAAGWSVAVVAAAAAAALPWRAAGEQVQLSLEIIAAGLASPTSLTYAPGDAERLFFTERAGRVRIIRKGALLDQPFLDISGQVTTAPGERAMSSLAFHPDYQSNGTFFVIYTDTAGDSVLARFTVSGDPDVADAASQAIVLTVPQPFPTHNVGPMAFGPDGYLYIGSGDGGADTGGVFAQNTGSLLGKILRIDVDGPAPYGIPRDNPFVGTAGLDEIWALGLRNPWRISFDRLTGDLWIADVGESSHEEIDFQPARAPGGANYGWNCMEGDNCYPGGGCTCNAPGLTDPVHEYMHGEGCAVIGGYVYRGCALPHLVGRYVFADRCDPGVRVFDPARGTVSKAVVPLPAVNSLGEDLDGEIYILTVVDIRKVTYADCNANGVSDVDDVASGTSPDCNANGIPDECDVADCNGNGRPDSCDIADGTSPDANGNAVPDECDNEADLDSDGIVGVTDLLILLGQWGPCPAGCSADINEDGAVDVVDLLTLLGFWG